MTARLNVIEGGGDGPSLVLLHGFGGCAELWHPVAQALADVCHVIAYDLPGHGGSLAWPGAGPAKVAADVILSDLAARGLGSIHLAGHSMGGAVATLMAVAEPARVRSLTLLAPGGFGPQINAPLLRSYGAARTSAEIRDCLIEMSGPRPPDMEAAVKTLGMVRSAAGQHEKLVEIAAAITRNDRQGVIPHDWLAALGMPTTVIWGTADPLLPFLQSEDLPPNIRRLTIEDVGHMLIEEAPDAVVQALGRQIAGKD